MDQEIRKKFTKLAYLFTTQNDVVVERRILKLYTKESIEKALELDIIAIDHIDNNGERYFKITKNGTNLW